LPKAFLLGGAAASTALNGTVDNTKTSKFRLILLIV